MRLARLVSGFLPIAIPSARGQTSLAIPERDRPGLSIPQAGHAKGISRPPCAPVTARCPRAGAFFARAHNFPQHQTLRSNLPSSAGARSSGRWRRSTSRERATNWTMASISCCSRVLRLLAPRQRAFRCASSIACPAKAPTMPFAAPVSAQAVLGRFVYLFSAEPRDRDYCSAREEKFSCPARALADKDRNQQSRQTARQVVSPSLGRRPAATARTLPGSKE